MEHEIRYYLKQMLSVMNELPEDEKPQFIPKYLVTAVQLPTGAVELAVNNDNIKEKIEYILEAYDDNMCLKTNANVVMLNIMVV